jgi:hypothetical protein
MSVGWPTKGGQITGIPRSSRERTSIHWPSALQLGLSLFGILIFWTLSGSFAVIGLAGVIDPIILPENNSTILMLAAGMFQMGLLMIPSAWFAFLRVIQSAGPKTPALRHLKIFRPTILIFFLPLVVLAGFWVSGEGRLSWFLLPPLHVLAISLPILWLASLGRRGLSTGSSQRDWGSFGAGLTLSPILILILEFAALGLIFAFTLFYLYSQPELWELLTNLAYRLSQAPPNVQIIQRILAPHLSVLLSPGIIYTAFIFFAMIVPLIEELLKPIGVWLMIGKNLTPSAGFAAGVLGGAAYALFESLMFAPSPSDWALLVSSRIGTGVMHIATAGLTGWALAYAWQSRNYLQLVLAYLVAVIMHGLWNGLVVMGMASQFVPSGFFPTSLVENLGVISPVGLGVLAMLNFSFLLLANRKLRRSQEITGA